MADDEKPMADADQKVMVSAAEAQGIEDRVDPNREPEFHKGLSFTPGLQEIEGSQVPFAEHQHVRGPQQNPADPVAAGLTTQASPYTRAENRVVNRTGEIGSGPHAPGTTPAVSDHSSEPAKLDNPEKAKA